jgi:hypothetical protein
MESRVAPIPKKSHFNSPNFRANSPIFPLKNKQISPKRAIQSHQIKAEEVRGGFFQFLEKFNPSQKKSQKNRKNRFEI